MYKFKRLYIKGFKNIKEVEIVFKNRIILITGDNWSGKSSLITALTYLVTDDLEEKISEYINWDSDRFEIEFEFEHDGRNCDYKVIGKKSKTERELNIEGEKEPFYHSDAVVEMKKLSNPILTLYSAISQQHESTAILFEKGAQRLEKLKQVFQMELVDKAVAEVYNDRYVKKKEIETLQTEIDTLVKMEYNLQDVPDVPDIDEVKKEFDQLGIKKKAYDAQKALYDKYEEELANYEDTQKKIKIEETILATESEGLEELVPRKIPEFNQDELDILNSELTAIKIEKSQYDGLVSQFDSYTQILVDIDNLRETRKNQQGALSSIVGSRTLYGRVLANPEEERQKLEDAKIDLADKKKQLDLAEKGLCPTCGKPYIIDDIEKFKEDIEYIQKHQVDRITNNLKRHEEDSTQIALIDKELAILNTKIESTDIDLKKKEEDLKKCEITEEPKKIDYNDAIQKLEEKIKALDVIRKLVDQVKKDNEEINKKRSKVEASISAINARIDMLKNIKEPEQVGAPEDFENDKYDDLQKQINVYEEKVAERDRVLAFNKRVEFTKEENEETIVKKTKERDDKIAEMQQLQETETTLSKKFAPYLIQDGTEYISNRMNDFFQRVHGEYLINFMQSKNSVNFFYSPKSEIVKPVILSSGMERQLLALAFRVALCSMQNLGFIILDEADESGSSNNSIKLFRNLLELPEFQQILIITHKEGTINYLVNEHNADVFRLEKGKLVNNYIIY